MSLITRCPACQTLFKVVPDQLRISEGWVRCGSCEAIFDATLHLLPNTAQEEDTAPNPETTAQPFAPPADTIDAVPEAPPVSPDQAPDQTLQPVSDDTANSIPPTSTEEDVASFLTPKPATTPPRKNLQRVVLALLGLALVLGLAAQIVFHERDRIVALQPALRPWLVAFCQPFKCKLSALRQKDAITIDRASFNKISANTYRLNFTVKNSATVAVAAPAIELTLTDTSDQPVLRRVFLPTELEFKSDTLPPSGEWSASLVVTANLSDNVQQTIGYRIYAFYP